MAEEKEEGKKDKKINYLKEIEKKYGKGKLITGTEYRLNTPIIASTGSFALDIALGCGGIPEGRMLEYYGQPSGGKSTLSLISMVEVQKKGFKTAIVDLEKTFDRQWFENMGGNSELLLYTRPSSGAEALDIIEMLVKSNEVSLIVVDSVSAMLTSAEKEADYAEATMAQLARLLSSGLKKLNDAVGNSKCSVIWINQTRSGIGMYSPPVVTTGGNALKFYTSIRLMVSRGDVIGEADDPDGFLTKVKVEKNKCGPPKRIVVTNLYIGKNGKYGIDKDEEVIDVALFKGLIKRVKKEGDGYIESETGKSYQYRDYVVMGKQNFINSLLENKEIFEAIKNEITQIFVEQDIPEEGSYNDEVNQEIIEQEIVEEVKKERKTRKSKIKEGDEETKQEES